MPSIKTWLDALRPRTLMLSASGILMGSFLAAEQGYSRHAVFAFAMLTALCLQILSNLSNDYGDFKTGVDNPERLGPLRGVQSGKITEHQMKLAIVVFALSSLFFGFMLLFVTSHFSWTELLIFALLGLAAVLAAMLYTLGPRPYGYRGWGDLYCFLFFGIASVFGTYYLATQSLDWNILLPASSLGLLSNAVLNINNMRDCENDRINSKNTLVVKIGLKKAYIYHSFLLFTPFLLFTLYNVFTGQKSSAYFFWMMFPLFAADWLHIVKTKELSELDPFLKKQVIKTFLLVLFYGLLLQL